MHLQVYTYITLITVVHCYTTHFPVQDAAVALVLSEAVYKQLDAGGVEEATSAISPLMQELLRICTWRTCARSCCTSAGSRHTRVNGMLFRL